MGFKLKGAPYDKSNMNIAVYKKDLTDGSIGKSNHTGIIVQSGISPEEEQHVIAHEKVHQDQQAKGELDYDKENFYWKGKTYPRENLNEHNEELPWEKEAYKASKESRNKEAKEMGSTKFKLKGHRGNNKPFKHMTERNLIGASMDDTSGYNQPDYGSSMYDDGASAETCGPDGGDECDAFSNKGKPKKIKTPTTKVSKDSKYKLRQSQVDVEKTTKGTNVQEVGISKGKGGKDSYAMNKREIAAGVGKEQSIGSMSSKAVGTTPSSKSGQTKAEYIANKGGKGNAEMAGRVFDKYQKDDKTVTTAKIKNLKRNKINKKGNETFDRGVKTTTTINPSGNRGKVTDLKVSKKKLIGKGIKTKSYTSNSGNNKKVTGVKTLSVDRLQNKATKATRKIKGYKNTERDLKGNKGKTRKGKKTSLGLGVITAGNRSTNNPMLR